MKNKFLLLLIFSIFSCNSADSIKIGTYKYYSPNRLEFGFRYIFQEVIGTHCSTKQLTINADSTFDYDLHSEIYKGSWTFLNDSLYLNVRDIVYIDEKLKKYYAEEITYYKYKPIVFKANGNNLVRIIGIKHHKIIEKLKFNTP